MGGEIRAPNGDDESDRGRAAEIVAVKLGELLEDLHDDVVALPRWRPSPGRRQAMERSIAVGLSFFHAWRDAFGDRVA